MEPGRHVWACLRPFHGHRHVALVRRRGYGCISGINRIINLKKLSPNELGEVDIPLPRSWHSTGEALDLHRHERRDCEIATRIWLNNTTITTPRTFAQLESRTRSHCLPRFHKHGDQFSEEQFGPERMCKSLVSSCETWTNRRVSSTTASSPPNYSP